MLHQSLRVTVLFVLAAGLLRECRAEHLWIVPEPIGFDGRVHVCTHHGLQLDQVPHLLGIQLWRISGERGDESVQLAGGTESLVASEGVSDTGLTYMLSHDCGLSSIGVESSRTLLHAKAYTSADPSTWRPLPRKRLPLEILAARDREAFTFTVNFTGRPVANPRVTVHGPDGFQCESEGNSEGQVSCVLPQSGMYGLTTSFIDLRPGKIDGEEFSKTHHFSTLTLPVEVIPPGK